MSEPNSGYNVVFLLMGTFRRTIDDLHTALAHEGFPGVRPAHGFALQAIGADTISITELGRRLGVSKQAAAKTVQALGTQGYIVREPDPSDARASRVRRSQRGLALLSASERFFSHRQQEWIEALGADRYAALVADLEIMSGNAPFGDFAAWLQSPPGNEASS